MDMLPFVDAHVHLWDLDHIAYPWLRPPFNDDGPNGSTEAIARNYLLDDYRADTARWNLTGLVHIDAGAESAAALDETRWLERIAADHGMPNGIVAYAALDDDDVEAQLEAQTAHRHVCGIRQIVNWHADKRRSYTPADLTLNDAWRSGFGRLERHGLSFDLQCYPSQMPGLASLFRRHPGVPVILNHLGMPILSDPDGLAHWRAGMRALAACSNVTVKLSGFGFIDRNWTFDRIAPLLHETVDLYGPSRCMVASDSPTDKLFAPFDVMMDALSRFCASYSEQERRDLWGRNANRIYRLGLEL